jgi:hypothetical protein
MDRPPKGPRNRVAHASRNTRSKLAHAIRDSGPSLYVPAAIQSVDMVFSLNKLYRIVCLNQRLRELSSKPRQNGVLQKF